MNILTNKYNSNYLRHEVTLESQIYVLMKT